jgi:hypothetical protein
VPPEATRAHDGGNDRIKKDAAVKPEIVARFVRGERDIPGGTFAKIAPALGLELRKQRE